MADPDPGLEHPKPSIIHVKPDASGALAICRFLSQVIVSVGRGVTFVTFTPSRGPLTAHTQNATFADRHVVLSIYRVWCHDC